MAGTCKTHGAWPDFEGLCVECAKDAVPKEDITCPFCGRKDFDQPGLKTHFHRGWCEVFEQTETP